MLTAEQFQKAYEVAVLAADKGMATLSLKAMREAVRGGPPLVDNRRDNGGGGYRTRVINGVQYLVPQGGARYTNVDRALLELAPKWNKLQVPPAEIYEVLAAAVLPEARPAEIFLYNEGEALTNIYRSIGGVWTPTDEPIETESQEPRLCPTCWPASPLKPARTMIYEKPH